jgi:integrase
VTRVDTNHETGKIGLEGRRGDLNLRREASLLQTSLSALEPDLKLFETFCRIDKNISSLVAHRHCLNIRSLYRTLDYRITKHALRQYLLDKKTILAVKTYANILCSMKRYFRDYLGSSIVDSFEFPKIGFTPRIVPSKKQLQIFFNALPMFPRVRRTPLPKYHALFLLLASSGLRLREALSLTRDDIYPEQRMLIPRNAHETNARARIRPILPHSVDRCYKANFHWRAFLSHCRPSGRRKINLGEKRHHTAEK